MFAKAILSLAIFTPAWGAKLLGKPAVDGTAALAEVNLTTEEYMDAPPLGSTKIPHVIYVTHDGVKPRWKADLQSWAVLNPTWERKEYSSEMNYKVIKERYPWFVKTFDTLNFDVERYDVVRYVYMHSFGGLYHDMDIGFRSSLEPLEKVLDTQGIALLEEQGYIQNYFFASMPGHDYWLKILKAVSAVNSLPEIPVERMNYEHKRFSRVLCVTGWPLMTYVWKYGFNGTLSGAGTAGGTSYLVLSAGEWQKRYGIAHHFTGTWVGQNSLFFHENGRDRMTNYEKELCEVIRPGWCHAIDSVLGNV